MATTTTPDAPPLAPPMTADEFAARYLDDRAHKRTELVRGEVREMTPASGPHGWLGARLLIRIGGWVEAQGLGGCFDGQTGFRLVVPGRPGDTVLSPDLGFVPQARLADVPTRGFIPFAPDFAVEVVSPDDRPGAIAEKLAEYLAAGTRLVWIVYPAERSVAVHVPDAPPRYARTGETLDGGDVLPGLSLRVADLFDGMPGR